MFNAIKKFFVQIRDFLSMIALDGFDVRTVPDDVPFREIKVYRYDFYANEFFFTQLVQLVQGGPTLMPFWDQNNRMCVKDRDGTIYRIKDD